MTGRRKTNLRAAAARRDPVTPPAGATAIRSKPVRVTADLDPVLYGDVNVWLATTGVELRRKVALVDALRVLLTELVEDDVLAARVRDRLSQ
jgi:hypothetical protein